MAHESLAGEGQTPAASAARPTNVEGLAERSLTEYRERELVHSGVRGVGGELGMQATVRAFGAILVIQAWGTGSEVERRELRPGLPTLDVIFVEQGEFEYLDGTMWKRSRGPLMVAPSGLPQRVRFIGEWRFIVARIPREAMLPYVPLLADTVGIYSDLTVPERAMQAFLTHAVASGQEVSEGESRTVDRLVLDMAGALVAGRQGAGRQPGTPHSLLRDRALAVIAEQSSDPRLAPAGVAAEVGSSLRHLQAVFAEVGTSVAGEIRRTRARTARVLLQDGGSAGLDIATIAVRAGFGSSASMRRVLEELYGAGPRELRSGQAEDPGQGAEARTD